MKGKVQTVNFNLKTSKQCLCETAQQKLLSAIKSWKCNLGTILSLLPAVLRQCFYACQKTNKDITELRENCCQKSTIRLFWLLSEDRFHYSGTISKLWQSGCYKQLMYKLTKGTLGSTLVAWGFYLPSVKACSTFSSSWISL